MKMHNSVLVILASRTRNQMEKTLPTAAPKKQAGVPRCFRPIRDWPVPSPLVSAKGVPTVIAQDWPFSARVFRFGQPRFPPATEEIRGDAIGTLSEATMWWKHAALRGSNTLRSYGLLYLRFNRLRQPLLVASSGALFTTTATCQKIQYPPRPKPPPDEEITEVYLKGSGPGGQKIVRPPFPCLFCC